jgi:dimethylglycine oxidase
VWIAEAVWITHSGGVGRTIAEKLVGRKASIEVTEFDPLRFAGRDIGELRERALALYSDIYVWPDEVTRMPSICVSERTSKPGG